MDKSNLSIADIYADFARIIPPTAPQVQRTEMRRSFYAGALAAFTCFVEATNHGEAAGVEKIEAIHQELRRYGEDLAAGRA